MLSSMTGFARSESDGPWGALAWELRSVNHRYLEISLRLPEPLRAIEPAVREQLQHALTRGKVDAVLRYEPVGGRAQGLRLNEPLIQAVIDASIHIEGLMMNSARANAMDILRWPGVVEPGETGMQDVAGPAMALLIQAIAELKAVRDREGDGITTFLRERALSAREEVARARERRPEVLRMQKEKLLARIADLGVEADEARVAQELAHAAQRLDVEEELARLESHIDTLVETLDASGSAGRRLDVLLQEMNREANTLASKSGDLITTQAAMALKVLIEQMREQVQNVE